MTQFETVLANFNKVFPQGYNRLAILLNQVPVHPKPHYYVMFDNLLTQFEQYGCHSSSTQLVSMFRGMGLDKVALNWRKVRA